MSGESKRTIKLFCPSLSRAVPFVAWEEQRLDLGSIARAFGLDPKTVKLNGHFIGRGVDLVASSVTWKSLLSFFSSRGLSTGTTDADALVVDGKLAKAGTKRVHEPANVKNEMSRMTECDRNPGVEDTNLLKRKKLREGNSGNEYGACQITKGKVIRPFGMKRKQSLEDVIPAKRLREITANSGNAGRGNDLTFTVCAGVNEHLKRMRENEMVVAAPSKRTR